MTTIKAKIIQDRKRITDFKKKLNNLGPAWDKIGKLAQDSIQKNFDVGGRPVKWTPRKKSVPWPILKKSGTLQLANVIELIPGGTSIVNYEKYQAVHNFGYPVRNIAQREYMLLQPEEENVDIPNIFREHLKF